MTIRNTRLLYVYPVVQSDLFTDFLTIHGDRSTTYAAVDNSIDSD